MPRHPRGSGPARWRRRRPARGRSSSAAGSVGALPQVEGALRVVLVRGRRRVRRGCRQSQDDGHGGRPAGGSRCAAPPTGTGGRCAARGPRSSGSHRRPGTGPTSRRVRRVVVRGGVGHSLQESGPAPRRGAAPPHSVGPRASSQGARMDQVAGAEGTLGNPPRPTPDHHRRRLTRRHDVTAGRGWRVAERGSIGNPSPRRPDPPPDACPLSPRSTRRRRQGSYVARGQPVLDVGEEPLGHVLGEDPTVRMEARCSAMVPPSGSARVSAVSVPIPGAPARALDVHMPVVGIQQVVDMSQTLLAA